MNNCKWQKFTLILLTISSLVTYADPYEEATNKRHPVVGSSYFGTHFRRLVLTDDEVSKGYHATEWPAQVIGNMRLWDSRVRWADLESSRGRWDFRRMDTYIKEASINGSEIIYTLGSTPQWASARPLKSALMA